MIDNYKKLDFNKITPVAGIAGCLIIGFGLIASASHYTRSIAYSPRNHFISELGLPEASTMANVFNYCVNMGGVLLMVFLYGLGNYLHKTPLARYAKGIGIIAALSFSFIGYYTADTWVAHKNVTAVFFTGAVVSISLFSYCILENKYSRIHQFISVLGFSIVIIFITALVWPKALMVQYVNQSPEFVRPDLWGLTVLEWTYCLLIGFWILSVSADMVYVLSKEE
jgi:hypothetical protein